MPLLSPNFDQSEFEKDAPLPAECVSIFTRLCLDILEPVRTFIDRPIKILSGYRPPAANEAAHGVKNSEHVATKDWCAADFAFDAAYGAMLSVRSVFDWIRNSPTLPFRQVILEHGANGRSIIHVSINTTNPTRQALEGQTYNQAPYTSWEVATYIPPIVNDAAQENA